MFRINQLFLVSYWKGFVGLDIISSLILHILVDETAVVYAGLQTDSALLQQEYLEDTENVNYETFHDKVWPNIKEIYKPDGEKQEGKEEPAKGDTEQPPVPTATPDPVMPPPQVCDVTAFLIHHCF